MSKPIMIALSCLSLFSAVQPAFAEDYPDCRLRCETDYTDCSNQTPAPEPEVQAAKMATCDKGLATCYAQCENLKPVEVPDAVENNPNIIRK